MRTCTICSHPQRAEIEEELARRTSYRRIASTFGVGYKAVERHKEHIEEPIQQAQAMPERLSGLTLAQRIEHVYTILDEVLEQATDAETKLKALKVITSVMKLEGRLLGLFQQPRENDSDVARKREMYERYVARLLAAATEHGFEFSREEAIRRLAAFSPEIDDYIH